MPEEQSALVGGGAGPSHLLLPPGMRFGFSECAYVALD